MEQADRKQNRIKDYDYSQNGAYFITICTKGRKNLLYAVGAAFGRPNETLSDTGKIVDNEIAFLSEIYENVWVDKYVIMPNHIHMIIIIQSGRSQIAPTLSRIIQQFKGAVTKQTGFSVWQKSFYDHIIRNEQDYLEVWNYIDTNSAKWEEENYFKDKDGIIVGVNRVLP